MLGEVLLDATPLARGHAARGIGSAVTGLIAGFAALDRGERPDLLVAADQSAPPGFRTTAVRWPAWRPYRIPDPWPALVGERRLAGRPQAVFHATQPELIPAGGGLVVTCYDLIGELFERELLGGPDRLLQRLGQRRQTGRLRRAAAVVVATADTADDVVALAGVAARRIRVIPWATPAPAAPEGPPPSAPYVLYAGGLEAHKNAQLAVAALACAPSDVRLAMAGPWSERRRRRLAARATALGVGERIDWLGYVSASRLAALRAGAVAVLVPSRKEGFGLPVLEAMAAGTPALCADIPALRAAGAGAGVYLPLDDPSAWGGAVARLLDHPAERGRIVDRGRRHAGERTWADVAREHLAVYREVIDG